METTSPTTRALAYGPKFKYDEFMVTKGRLQGLLLSLGLAFSAICLMMPPVRLVLPRFPPFSADSTPHRSAGSSNASSHLQVPGLPKSASSFPLQLPSSVHSILIDIVWFCTCVGCRRTATWTSRTSPRPSRRPRSRAPTSGRSSVDRAIRGTRLRLVRPPSPFYPSSTLFGVVAPTIMDGD